MSTIRATVVAKEKIRHKHLYFISLCGNTWKHLLAVESFFFFFKDVLVTVLNSKAQVDSRGAEPTGENCF